MLHSIINNCLRASVLPSLGKDNHKEHLLFSKLLADQNQDDFRVSEYFVPTKDDVQLSTVSIDPKFATEDLYLIHFLGSSQTYEAAFPELLDISKENKCRVISFNYRGVAKSTGVAKNIDDLYNDGIVQVERLLGTGIKNIVISGFSLGGGLATKVVHHFHNNNKKLYLFNDRSFSKISDVAGAWHGKILKPILKKILNSFNWDLEVSKLYLQIPAKYRRHINLVEMDDEVVPFYVSLSKGLQDLKHKVSEEFLLHCTAEFKSRGHKAPLDKILNRYGESGKIILKKFISEIRQQISR